MRHVSRVQLERLVDCPFSEAEEVAEDILRVREEQAGDRLRFVFARHPDDAEPGRLHDALLVEWSARTRLLPHFHGTVRLRIATVRLTRVILEGCYRPPLGKLGRLFDAIVGRRLACAALTRLLDAVCDAMEARERVRLMSGSAV